MRTKEDYVLAKDYLVCDPEHYLFKIGDGVTPFNRLLWLHYEDLAEFLPESHP